jgi:hypothetical protein
MIAITVFIAAFLGGAVTGVIVLLRAGIAREESDKSLRSKPAARSAAATRRVVGLYVRTPPGAPETDDAAERTARSAR